MPSEDAPVRECYRYLSGPMRTARKGDFKVLMDTKSVVDANKVFNEEKADHRILNSALQLQKEAKDRKVILVSKDVNLRLKAKALGLQAEDYTTGKVQNISSLYSGKTIIEDVDTNMINLLYEKGYCPPGELLGKMAAVKNHYYILKSGKKSALAYYNPLNEMLEHVEKRAVYGVKPRNAEQTFAIHAALKQVKACDQKTIIMSQGNKESRLVAWTFLNASQQAAWAKLRWSNSKK